MTPLILQTLRDKRWNILGWSIGLISMAVFTIVFFPSISQSNGLDQLSESVPAEFQGLVGDTSAFKELPNYLGQQVFDLRLPIITLIFAIMLASSLTVREEEEGTLKTLQRLPISRTSVVLAKWAALCVLTATIALAAFVGVLLGIAIIGESVDLEALIFASLLLWLLTLSVASITFMVGLSSGRRGLTIAFASIFLVVNILVATMAAGIDSLKEVAKFTLYYYYNTPKLIIENPELSHVMVFAAAIALSLAITLFFYRRRDIN